MSRRAASIGSTLGAGWSAGGLGAGAPAHATRTTETSKRRAKRRIDLDLLPGPIPLGRSDRGRGSLRFRRGRPGARDLMSDQPSLRRSLGPTDAVVMGLGAMIGAGVFSAIGPAAEAAGPALLVGLVLAAGVAFCNAVASAQLAAVYPESGGTYVYGRERLGAIWGFLAGWGFVVGKTASLTAMALTVGAYLAPGSERLVAVVALVAMTAVNLVGIRKTASVTWAIVAIVLAVLVAAVLGTLFGGTA